MCLLRLWPCSVGIFGIDCGAKSIRPLHENQANSEILHDPLTLFLRIDLYREALDRGTNLLAVDCCYKTRTGSMARLTKFSVRVTSSDHPHSFSLFRVPNTRQHTSAIETYRAADRTKGKMSRQRLDRAIDGRQSKCSRALPSFRKPSSDPRSPREPGRSACAGFYPAYARRDQRRSESIVRTRACRRCTSLARSGKCPERKAFGGHGNRRSKAIRLSGDVGLGPFLDCAEGVVAIVLGKLLDLSRNDLTLVDQRTSKLLTASVLDGPGGRRCEANSVPGDLR